MCHLLKRTLFFPDLPTLEIHLCLSATLCLPPGWLWVLMLVLLVIPGVGRRGLVECLGPPGEVLIEWPDGSTHFPLVCVRRLQSHSLSSMLNEMCFGALCRGERRKNNGHSDRIKVYLVLFRNPALSSSWSWCSHNGQSLVLHSDMPKARKTSHPGRKPLKEINT